MTNERVKMSDQGEVIGEMDDRHYISSSCHTRLGMLAWIWASALVVFSSRWCARKSWRWHLGKIYGALVKKDVDLYFTPPRIKYYLPR